MILFVQQDEQERRKNMKNILKEVREEKEMSQQELAEKSSVSRTTISELETGKTEVVTNTTLEKIAKALNRKVTDIFFQD